MGKEHLLNKMKANKDISMRKNSNSQMWSESMLRIAVKKGQLSIADFEKVTTVGVNLFDKFITGSSGAGSTTKTVYQKESVSK